MHVGLSDIILVFLFSAKLKFAKKSAPSMRVVTKIASHVNV